MTWDSVWGGVGKTYAVGLLILFGKVFLFDVESLRNVWQVIAIGLVALIPFAFLAPFVFVYIAAKRFKPANFGDGLTFFAYAYVPCVLGLATKL